MAPTDRTADLEVITDKTVREQLVSRNIRIPAHATASLERTRQAILQLSCAGMLTDPEYARLQKRFSKELIPQVVRTYKGKGALR